MKNRFIIAPFFMFALANAQQKYVSRVEYGFSATTFSGVGLQAFSPVPRDISGPSRFRPVRVPLLNYGWQEGFFLWITVKNGVFFKPQLEVGALVSDYSAFAKRNGSPGYSSSFILSFKPQCMIALRKIDRHPIIKMAKCMSYYILSRQPYFIFGPKLTCQETDRNFRNRNLTGHYTIGACAGLGVNNAFQNLNVAPEVYCSLECAPETASGSMLNPKNYMFSVTVSASFF